MLLNLLPKTAQQQSVTFLYIFHQIMKLCITNPRTTVCTFLMSFLSKGRKFILSHQRYSCLPCPRDETLSYQFPDVVPVHGKKMYLVPPKVCLSCLRDETLSYQFPDVVLVHETKIYLVPPKVLMHVFLYKRPDSVQPVSWCRSCPRDETLSYQFPNAVPVHETRLCPTSFLVSSLSKRDDTLSYQSPDAVPG